MPEILAELPAPAKDRAGQAPVGLVVPTRRHWKSRGRHLALPRGSDALLFIAVLALAVTLLGFLPASFSVDSWLALVVGRDIWHTGLPHHDTLTVISHGVRWVDQQWLAQLASYALYRAGGLGLLGVVNVALITIGVGGAVAGARRLGARPWIVMFVLLLALWQIIPFREVRTQAFAFPLITAMLVLLSHDSRRPSRRVYWCFPILILWGNLHGTVTIGAALVSLRGVTLAWERRGQLRTRNIRQGWAQWRRPLILTVGAPLTLLMTPYGFQAVSYYQATLMNSELKAAVTEWQPITSHIGMAAVFFLLAGLAVWSFGRQPSKTTSWEKITLLLLAAASVDVLRNSLLFGLAALLIVPVSLDGALPIRRSGRTAVIRDRLNARLCWTMIGVLATASLATVFRPASGFESSTQRPALLVAVRAETQHDPAIRVFADLRFADWLLWRDPQLGGRIANDVRFELLSDSELIRIQRVFSVTGPDWKQAARGYRLLVLDRAASPDAVKGFLQEPGRRVLYNDGQRLVILRSVRAAA
jgi:hypothetical protein